MSEQSKINLMFRLAKEISLEATCPSRNVGCVVVDPATWYVVAMGYNGAPSGTPHCGDACRSRQSGKNYEKCMAIHAELNAIVYAARKGVSLEGCHMFLTTTPCVFCSRVIIQSGIEHVYANSHYSHPAAEPLLKSGGVGLTVFSGVSMSDIERSFSERSV